ncbi:uracil-xanthine permease family protein [Sporohalobacter salinus]|uniref:uracil-xanthine permease family protein n=1 Tax=Sporohalobacter salinus TaxID=1494606 RepID=UPI001960389B|nr:nucleobase:cation symporter-2 family protein [Sporohalobacter salinus]MBM7622490.1 NCS2 family nucleobase:cation symporter-2/xanthine permease XanP [Sporohalobacter salinus]
MGAGLEDQTVNHEGQSKGEAPIYELEDEPPLGETIFLGLQHMLAMFVGIVTPPIIIAGVAGLGVRETGFFVSMALIISGVTSYVQCRRFGAVGSGLLGVHGTSFTFVPMAIAAANQGGIPLVLGMALAASPVEIVLSRFVKQAKKFFPPVVTGTVVMLIGMGLMEVGITDLAGGQGAQNFGSPMNLLLGTFVLLTIIFCNRYGSGLVKVGAIFIGLAAGYLISIPLGIINFKPIFDAGWFTIPIPFKYGLEFKWAHLLPWMLAYFITSIETIGDLTAIAVNSGEPIEGKIHRERLSRGMLADGLGSALAAVFNTMPNTTFSQNAGVIQLTKVGSKVVGYAVAGMLFLLGILPKIGAIVSVMPSPVLGGATIALFGMVATSGIRIIVRDGLNDRKIFILSIALSLGLGVIMNPKVVDQLPKWLSTILSSGVTVGALSAMLLNLFLPAKETVEESTEEDLDL